MSAVPPTNASPSGGSVIHRTIVVTALMNPQTAQLTAALLDSSSARMEIAFIHHRSVIIKITAKMVLMSLIATIILAFCHNSSAQQLMGQVHSALLENDDVMVPMTVQMGMMKKIVQHQLAQQTGSCAIILSVYQRFGCVMETKTV